MQVWHFGDAGSKVDVGHVLVQDAGTVAEIEAFQMCANGQRGEAMLRNESTMQGKIRQPWTYVKQKKIGIFLIKCSTKIHQLFTYRAKALPNAQCFDLLGKGGGEDSGQNKNYME